MRVANEALGNVSKKKKQKIVRDLDLDPAPEKGLRHGVLSGGRGRSKRGKKKVGWGKGDFVPLNVRKPHWGQKSFLKK